MAFAKTKHQKFQRMRELTLAMYWPSGHYPKAVPCWNRIAAELRGLAEDEFHRGDCAAATEANELATLAEQQGGA